jgi:hypothetical protein
MGLISFVKRLVRMLIIGEQQSFDLFCLPCAQMIFFAQQSLQDQP